MDGKRERWWSIMTKRTTYAMTIPGVAGTTRDGAVALQAGRPGPNWSKTIGNTRIYDILWYVFLETTLDLVQPQDTVQQVSVQV